MSWQNALIALSLLGVLAGVVACLYEMRERRQLRKVLPAPSRGTARPVFQEHAHAVGHLRGIK